MADGDGGIATVGDPVNQSITVPVNTNNDQPSVSDPSVSDPGADNFIVPDTYKDKPYLQNVKNNDDLFKLLDNSQQALGKKITFLTDQSTDEERLNFNRSAGMPEKAGEYTFEKIGDRERNNDVDSKFKEIFHKHGLSGKAVTGMQKDVELYVAETKTKMDAAEDVAFNELSSKILGDKADEIIASSKKLIEANIPQELVESFGKLSNSALVTMSTVIENIRRKYISEDTITEGTSPATGQSKEDLQKKSDELMKHPAYKNGMHVDHKKINDQIKEVSKLIANIKK